MFVKPQAKNEGNKRYRRTSEVTDVDAGSWRSGCCKEKSSISLEIAAVPSAAMVRVGFRAGLLLYGTPVRNKYRGSQNYRANLGRLFWVSNLPRFERSFLCVHNLLPRR